MTSIVREGLCPIAYCPAPADEEVGGARFHLCFVCGAQEIHHHHVRPRGMGGSESRKMDKPGVVALCPAHHEAVTVHDATDGIADFPGRGRVYFYLDRHGETLCERLIGASDDSRGLRDTNSGARTAGGGLVPDAPGGHRLLPDGDKEASLRVDDDVTAELEAGPIEPLAPSVLGVEGSMGLSFERWLTQGKRLAAALRAAPWAIGDWLVAGERQYGQDRVWEAVDSLGMDYATLRNYQRVAEAFPAEIFPRESYPWGWWREVCSLPADSALAVLAEAQAGGEGRAGVVERRKEIEGVSVTTTACICPTCGQSHIRRAQ